MRAIRSLPRFRGRARSRMTLTLTAYSPTGTSAQNPVTGLEEPVFVTEGTTPGEVQSPTSQGGDTPVRYVNVGGVERPVLTAGLRIPVSADLPSDGPPHVAGGAWEYVVTALGEHDDPVLLGRRYRVVEVPAKSFATARRLDVVEV